MSAHEHRHEHDCLGRAHGPGGRGHAPASFGPAFAIATTLSAGLVAAQVFEGLAAHSVALLVAAIHTFGDVMGLLIAWGALNRAKHHPAQTHTYGCGRSTILASLTNAVVLLLGCGSIAVEATRRLIDPGWVGGSTVMCVAAVAIVVNGTTALIFMLLRKDDLNVKDAVLQIAAEADISAGVVILGLLIILTGWYWLDPVTSLMIIAIITFRS